MLYTNFKLEKPTPPVVTSKVVQPKAPLQTQKTEQSPPAYKPSAAQNINIDSIRKQEEELTKKTTEMDRKDESLRNIESGNGKFQLQFNNLLFQLSLS